jgi:hypothetical protein
MDQPQQPSEFPNGPVVKGKFYVMDYSPGTPHANRIIIMSEESWGDFGTTMESMRSILAKQNATIKELKADLAARDVLNADMLSRLEALRDVRRAERRPLIEAQVSALMSPKPETTNPYTVRK